MLEQLKEHRRPVVFCTRTGTLKTHTHNKEEKENGKTYKRYSSLDSWWEARASEKTSSSTLIGHEIDATILQSSSGNVEELDETALPIT